MKKNTIFEVAADTINAMPRLSVTTDQIHMAFLGGPALPRVSAALHEWIIGAGQADLERFVTEGHLNYKSLADAISRIVYPSHPHATWAWVKSIGEYQADRTVEAANGQKAAG